MTYLVNWQAKDHTKTIPVFQKAESTQVLVEALGATGISVLQSWHILGANRGLLIVQVTNPLALHTATVKLGTMFDVAITQVLSDTEAKMALK